jgi:hypothetical protein
MRETAQLFRKSAARGRGAPFGCAHRNMGVERQERCVGLKPSASDVWASWGNRTLAASLDLDIIPVAV